MGRLLNALWGMLGEYSDFEYERKEELLRRTVECEKSLEAVLSEEQAELFAEYRQAVDELCADSERAAFAKGVQFAVSFLTEALGKEE